MLDWKLRVLKNVFAMFDSVERHLVEMWIHFVSEKDDASDCKWTSKDEIFVQKN